MDNKIIGAIGEDAAAKYLARKGYTIRERNFRCRTGEIDIIATKDGVLSFIEVKTRQNFNYGRPCEAVTRNKQRNIKMSAEYYLKQLQRRGCQEFNVRFDVVEVVIRHTENAF
jgi:putative endonuclease